jgi:hypothetical protein
MQCHESIDDTMFATAIVAVLVASAAIGWGAWRVGKHAERSERDPKYRRRWWYIFGLCYIFFAMIFVAIAVSDRDPWELINLPFAAIGIWACFRAASKIVVSPDQNSH